MWRCALCAAQGDGDDLCAAVPAGGPDPEGAGGRDQPADHQDTTAGDRPDSLQDPSVSLAHFNTGHSSGFDDIRVVSVS